MTSLRFSLTQISDRLPTPKRPATCLCWAEWLVSTLLWRFDQPKPGNTATMTARLRALVQPQGPPLPGVRSSTVLHLSESFPALAEDMSSKDNNDRIEGAII